MNKLMLKEATQEYVVYNYTPEGTGLPREIRMSIKGGDASIVSCVESDNLVKRYAHKAVIAVRECIEIKNLPLESTQAWYLLSRQVRQYQQKPPPGGFCIGDGSCC